MIVSGTATISGYVWGVSTAPFKNISWFTSRHDHEIDDQVIIGSYRFSFLTAAQRHLLSLNGHGNKSCPVPPSFPSHSLLFSLLSSPNNVRLSMSLEQEFIWYSEGYPPSESADEMKKDLFFAPAPQVAYAPSPDTFDLEVDNYGGFEEFDLESSSKQIDDFFDTYHRYMPVVSTPSAVSHSTESLYEVSSSLYSCPTLSDCSTPSIQSENEFRGSVNEGLYSPHSSEYSAAFSDSPSCVPPTPANKARFDNKTIFDYGSMNLDQNFAGAQESAYVGSAAVHVVPDKAHEAVKRESVKRFWCPFCSHCESEARVFIIGSFLIPLASLRAQP